MAEAWLNHLYGDFFEAQSAGLEPGAIHPLTVEVMKEVGIDLSQKQTQSTFEIVKRGTLFGHVITVCDESSAEKCPIFPGITKRLHWSLPDPAAAIGTREEQRAIFRAVRDSIRAKVEEFCQQVRARET
jgi:arsenate reductase